MNTNIAPARAGLIYGLGAYLIWGLLPAFFKLLHAVSPGEIVGQRVLWSLLFIAGLVALRRSLPALRRALANPRVIGFLAISAMLIGVNWLIYVWAVINGHVLAASLGYFLNPLINVALGMIFLKERLGRVQMASVVLAAIGVAILALGASEGLWISLGLAFTFGFYGLVRKIAPVEALEGLAIETLILAPFALGWLLWLGQGDGLVFGETTSLSLLLAFGGVLTAVPLLLFAAAARRMPYAELGLLQYVAPTLQFLLAVIAYGEPMTQAHVICFAFIWTGLAIYAAGNVAELRRGRRAAAV
ncbi:EamA family transporter RarD [Sphingobium boeckii]|uniref:Chloramphenicol-sensitive protein RarD n=1 Tax=Sphingobium boeckii TaxID=1082345 RepID=A0A7W9AFI9_9SPHN|nr:EamA family transporter RarD [Sphingobium boeckii]MBB5684519.1 chloramphenicol-sensitive protein RarD [Sphingobium boeckii]